MHAFSVSNEAPTTPNPSSGRRGDNVYVLDMFPYPSGDGLHVGHPEGYTATDIYSRYLRMKGEKVLHPMGWDAFGLPTENAAIKKGIHPRIVTEQNVKNFKRQIQAIGFSYDWDREINTTDPKYYKWTQWIFLQLFKKGLAYEKEAPIWWCPKDKTGLANEEVVNGKCDRCGTTVEKKMLKQWMLKITAYADRLLEGLDHVDWPEGIKTLQRNWIGKSDGADVKFSIVPHQRVLVATNNSSKVERIRKLMGDSGVSFVTPKEEKISSEDAVEGSDLVANALAKTKSYEGKTTLPILGTDSGFFIDGVNEDPAKVKRNALRGRDEKEVPQEEVSQLILEYYQSLAKKHGGSVEAHWEDIFVLVLPDGTVKRSSSKRFVTLTSKVHKPVDLYFPMRSLYINRSTGKYSVDQTEDEELNVDLAPYKEALKKILFHDVIVFTTRPDTLFGATYLVLSPEHELVEQITTKGQKKAVDKYVKSVSAKSDLERATSEKEKTGVFTGAYAINPVNNEKIPVWIADYVLMSYGTGAIMAVPAHDKRDSTFAKKYKLPITTVIEPITGAPEKNEEFRRSIVAIVQDPKTKKVLTINWGPKNGGMLFVGGGREKDENPVDCTKREINEETGYTDVEFVGQSEIIHHHYFAHSKNVARNIEAIGLFFHLKSNKQNQQALEKDEEGKFTVGWTSVAEAGQAVRDPLHRYVFEKFITEACYSGEGIITNSGAYDGLSTPEMREKIVTALEKEGKAKATVQYKLRDWVFSRQRYWGEPIPLVKCESCKLKVEGTPHYLHFYKREIWDSLSDGSKTIETRALNPEEPGRYFGDIKPEDYVKAIFKPTGEVMWLRVKGVKTYKSLAELYKDKDALKRKSPGRRFASVKELEKAYDELVPGYADRINKHGLAAFEVKPVIPGIIPLKEHELPLELPDVEKYEPTGTGESPLAAIDEWVNVTCRACGKPAKRETNTMPQWAGSCWYYIRFADPHNDKAIASNEAMKTWLPVDLYVGGAEHAVLHLLYARFWHKVLYDVGAIPKEVGDEPFMKLKNQGLILGPDGEKMSKSRGNVINPDEIIAKYGADTLRMYEMFMGPFEDAKPWDTNGIVGVRRFLERVVETSTRVGDATEVGDVGAMRHGFIKSITVGIEEFRFNTCVSDFMKWINHWKKWPRVPREEFEVFLKLLSPFAPHIAEELWSHLGHKTLLAQEKWPKFDPKKIKEETVTIAIQVMGKLRGTVAVSAGAAQEEVETLAKVEPNVAKYLTSEPKKIIFVKDKLINFMV